MTTRRNNAAIHPRLHERLALGGLRIAVECRAPACLAGVRALTRLFPQAENGTPDLRFALEETDGAFALTLDDEELWRGRDAGETVAAFEFHFYDRVVRALYPPLVSLHAATVAADGARFTFAGHSGAGKSSLCTAALLDGADYFSDEFTLLDERGRLHPFPRPLQWDGGAHPAFSTSAMTAAGFDRATYRFPGHDGVMRASLLWMPPRLARDAAPATHLLLPRHEPAAPRALLEPLSRATALMELAARIHQRIPADERIRLLHARLPEHVSFHRLIFSDCRAAWRKARALAESGAQAVRVSP